MDEGINFGQVDFVLGSNDNNKQDDEYEVIKMAEKEPLNDPSCNHIPVLEGDEMGDAVSVTCKNCPYGWYIPKDQLTKYGLSYSQS